MEPGPADQVLGKPRHPYTQLLLDSVPRTGEPLDEDLALRKPISPGNRRLPDGCYFATAARWQLKDANGRSRFSPQPETEAYAAGVTARFAPSRCRQTAPWRL